MNNNKKSMNIHDSTSSINLFDEKNDANYWICIIIGHYLITFIIVDSFEWASEAMVERNQLICINHSLSSSSWLYIKFYFIYNKSTHLEMFSITIATAVSSEQATLFELAKIFNG